MFASVCWTPFQIINVMNYKFNFASDEKMDIYVCDKFKDAKAIVAQLKRCSWVENAYFVENIDYDRLARLKRHQTILRDLILTKRIINKSVEGKYDVDQKKYDYIVSSGYLNFNVLFTTYLKKKNSEMNCFFLDDGMESYLEKNTKDTYSKLYKTISSLTKIGGAAMKVDRLYVYAPELVAKRERYEKVLKLPSLTESSKLFEDALKFVFQYESENIGSEIKVIYFDQLSTGDFNDDLLIEKQKKVLDVLEKKWDVSQWGIKLHPRSRLKLYSDESHMLTSNIPWELFCNSVVKKDTILIAISSTACITPKMIYDQEPVVIFLEKIFINDEERKVSDYFEKVKNLYKEENRFFIPKSLQEFETIIENLEI